MPSFVSSQAIARQVAAAAARVHAAPARRHASAPRRADAPRDFLQRAAELDERGVPRFVEKELRGYLRCGVLAHGFCRIQCGGCNYEHLVPLSCKGRGICPSCGGKRMTALAQHLTEQVLPQSQCVSSC